MTLPELRGVTPRLLHRALEDDGFYCRRVRGSHHIYEHPDGRRVILAFHAHGATFKPGTLRSILRATCWTIDDLGRLGLIDGRSRLARAA